MRPSFLGIGAQKCATTWLCDILSDHPEVCLGPKDIDFFSYFYDRGFQWYEQQFICRGAPTAIGEVSASYFHASAAPERVFAYDRTLRLVLFLRDPVERAFSNHKHEVRIGHLSGPDRSFEFGILNNPSYVEQGRYATSLERWLGVFPRAQLLVVLFDEVVADPAAAARAIYEFLRIDGSHMSKAIAGRSNASYVNRYPALDKARLHGQRALRALRLEWVWQAAATVGGRRLYRAVNRADIESVIPPMAESTRLRLNSEFRMEIERLERLLGRSLQHWL